MKKLLISAVTALTLTITASVAYAEGFSYGGFSEYAVEAEQFTLGVNAAYSFDNNVTATVALEGTDACKTATSTDCGFGFDNAELGVSYTINQRASVYTNVTLDSDLEYDDLVVGVALQF